MYFELLLTLSDCFADCTRKAVHSSGIPFIHTIHPRRSIRRPDGYCIRHTHHLVTEVRVCCSNHRVSCTCRNTVFASRFSGQRAPYRERRVRRHRTDMGRAERQERYGQLPGWHR